MSTSREQLESWMRADEDEHLEFKEASNRYDFEELIRYAVALANERGGKIILGVTDERPRRVCGTQAFNNLERTKAGLVERLHLRIDAEQVDYDHRRILIFHVPSRPIGMPIHYRGTYWMRCGDALVPMSPDQLKRIFEEAGPDFSAEICQQATLDDLSPPAIEDFRQRWVQKSGILRLSELSVDGLLSDAELVVDGRLTYAALILLGTRQALGKYLAQCEIVFEYRSGEASGPAQQRLELREGFFLLYDRLWDAVNLRNDTQHYRDGLFVWDVPTFNESVVREGLVNAASHRDYRLGGSVFVRQYPRRLEIVSPGGFPPGVTAENILWAQSPRNRRVAEVFRRCGLVERSGQGANLMFEESIKQSKPLPDYGQSNDFQVTLVLHGEVQDPLFLRYLEKIGDERLKSFGTRHFLALERVHSGRPIPDDLRPVLEALIEMGAVERTGRGRGTRYLLSRRFYELAGKKGQYTRTRGLDRNTNKALLLRHLQDNAEKGSRLDELCQVLPAESKRTVQNMLREMKAEGAVRVEGRTKAARWFPEEGTNA